MEPVITNDKSFSYKHVQRLLSLGYTEPEIQLKSIEKEYELEVPRRFRRLKLLYCEIFRNLLLLNFNDPGERKNIKRRFFNEWKEKQLPFTDYIVDELWESIAKEVYLQ